MSHERPVELSQRMAKRQKVPYDDGLEKRYRGAALRIAFLLRYLGFPLDVIFMMCDWADLNYHLPMRFNAMTGGAAQRLPGLAVVVESRTTHRILNVTEWRCDVEYAQCNALAWMWAPNSVVEDAVVVVYNRSLKTRWVHFGDAKLPIRPGWCIKLLYEIPLAMLVTPPTLILADFDLDTRESTRVEFSVHLRNLESLPMAIGTSPVELRCDPM